MPERSIQAALFSKDHQELIWHLGDHGVRYVVVGGIAVIFHGYVRFTGDIDFFYESVPVDAERLFRALTAFWKGEIPYIREPGEHLRYLEANRSSPPPP